MIGQDEVVRYVVDLLERLGIPYLVCGSYASNIWGHPRATHDADLVVELPEARVAELLSALGADFFAQEEAAREAVRLQDQFNVIHIPSGTKIDFWMRKGTPFDASQWERRRRESLWGLALSVASPEDTILAKLVWYRKSGGALGMQLRDALGVLEVQGDRLDRGYLRHWADALGVRDLLEQVEAEVP